MARTTLLETTWPLGEHMHGGAVAEGPLALCPRPIQEHWLSQTLGWPVHPSVLPCGSDCLLLQLSLLCVLGDPLAASSWSQDLRPTHTPH